MRKTNIECPICGFQELDFYPYVDGKPSFEICPSCFNQFGYDDVNTSHKSLREEWIDEGKNGCPPKANLMGGENIRKVYK